MFHIRFQLLCEGRLTGLTGYHLSVSIIETVSWETPGLTTEVHDS